MDDVPLHYVLGSYDRSVSEEHYGFPHIRPLLGEHPELAERYLREAEARWNTQYGQSAATTEVPEKHNADNGRHKLTMEKTELTVSMEPERLDALRYFLAAKNKRTHRRSSSGAGGAVRGLCSGGDPGLPGRPVPAGPDRRRRPAASKATQMQKEEAAHGDH